MLAWTRITRLWLQPFVAGSVFLRTFALLRRYGKRKGSKKMADRNPYIPSERAAEMDDKEDYTEDEGNERLAENEAELDEASADYPQGTHDAKPERTDQYAQQPGGKPQMRSMDEAAPKAS